MWEERIYKRNLSLPPCGGIKFACFLANGAGVPGDSRVLPDYTLVLVTRGRGKYRDETGVDLPVGKGDAILVRPGLRHWYGPAKGATWDEFYLVFEGQIFDLWTGSQCLAPEQPVISLSPMQFWHKRIMSVVEGPSASTKFQCLKDAVKLQELLLDIAGANPAYTHDDGDWLKRAKTALLDTMDVRRAAERLDVSYETFRKRFRHLEGVAPGKFRTGILMEEACAMLTERGMLNREIADELGYCDEYHFSRQFKSTVGCLPSEYRIKFGAKSSSIAGCSPANLSQPKSARTRTPTLTAESCRLKEHPCR